MQGPSKEVEPTPLAAAAAPARPPSREALAHAFMAEYHRLLADALAEADVESRASAARRRAFAWRVTAGRIPHVPGEKWPMWLIEQLRTAATIPVIGPEYQRQRELLATLLRAGAGQESGT